MSPKKRAQSALQRKKHQESEEAQSALQRKKTSGKHSSKKSSCSKIIYEKGRSAGLKSGREYHFTVYSVNAKGAMDWKHKKKFKMVYNPSVFKEKWKNYCVLGSRVKRSQCFLFLITIALTRLVCMLGGIKIYLQFH